MLNRKKQPVVPQLEPGNPLFGLGYAQPLQHRHFARVSNLQLQDNEGAVAEEAPIALSYNGRPHAVMMGTPADLEDFAVGFSLSEQIVTSASLIGGLTVVRHAQGVEIGMQIDAASAEALTQRARNLIGRTSCGLCGVELMSDVLRNTEPIVTDTSFGIDALMRAEAELLSLQPWNRETGAMHAAAWANESGKLTVVREDVGRHNALDKVIGALARQNQSGRGGFIVITSRASYELVQKTAVAGIPLMAAVSRPTGLAIRLAEAARVALVGLLRSETANIYADPNHVLRLPGEGSATTNAMKAPATPAATAKR
jgi:formate dehydrogenase accessory protein FdhD